MGGQYKARDQSVQELLELRTRNFELSQANKKLQREIEVLRRSEEALRDSEELYRTLVQILPDAVIVTNLDGYITYVSQRATELYGFEIPEELVGRSSFEFVAPEDRNKAIENLKLTIKQGFVRDVEYVFIRKDNTRFIGELNSALMKDAYGKPRAFAGTVRELIEYRQPLRALSGSERGTAVTGGRGMFEKRAVSSQKLASIGRLSLNLAHELNSSLDGVRRYMKLLIDEMDENSEERLHCKSALDGVLIMLKIVRRLLDFAHKEELASKPRDVRYCIERTVDSLSEELSARDIKIETEFGEGIAALYVDIDEISTNIVKNAIEAMTDGGTICVTAKMPTPQLIEIRFSDTGPGIPDEIRERIFEPFFTTKNSGQCIGLGLSICREIVDGYSGSIDVESELDRGTTFTVRLPVYKGRILVMDDEKSARDLTSEMLIRSGYKVTTATDGAEAVELYKEAMDLGQTYDAVILDLVVPSGTGALKTYEQLSEIDPDVRAIVSSAYQNDPVLSDFKKYGFKGAITKPYVAKGPDKAIQEVITGTGDWRGLQVDM